MSDRSFCSICKKTITTDSTIESGHGSRCAYVSNRFTPEQLIAHKKRFTLSGIPSGYVKTAIFHKRVEAAQDKGLAITVTKMVNAWGKDRATHPLANPICRFWYVRGAKSRYIHPWFASPDGIAALVSGDWSQAPKAPTKAELRKAIKSGETFSA